ncbi:MAG: fibronectin type III domain-containing protein [Propionibacteriaceae bacterium]|jgi:hypothetical protein|nr:fibronectin type III domain-containing protein [Propionibacteriaceae bacterium]
MSALTLALALPLALLWAPGGAKADGLLGGYGSIDRTSQSAVTNAYLNTYLPTLEVPIGWTGSTSQCVTTQPQSQPSAAAGAPSAAAQTATFTAVNYFRDMAGLKGVTESTAASALGQQAALIMQAQGSLNHYPPNTWPCWSQDGSDTAAKSNLSLGHAGARAVTGQVDDYGTSNDKVGHRRWILYPPTSTMGAGSTSGANALVVLGPNVSKANPEPTDGVAWPSAGYFPYQLLPTSSRWSYSVQDSAMASATISMTKNGTPVTVTNVQGDTEGYGLPTVVWNYTAAKPADGTVDHYQVTVSGITNPVSYTVDVYPVAEVSISSVGFTSYAAVGATLSAEVTATDGATISYEWLSSQGLSTGGTVIGTDATLTVPASAYGKYLSLWVTARKPGAIPATAHSYYYMTEKGTINGSVAISGTAKAGSTLQAAYTGGPAGATVSYTWTRGGTTVGTGPSYTVTTADEGRTLTVTATVTAEAYYDETFSATQAVPTPPKETDGGSDSGTNGGSDSGTNGGSDNGTNGGSDSGTNTNGGSDNGTNTTGTTSPTGKVVVKAVKIKKLTVAKKAVKVTWAKAAKAQQVTSYQLAYRLQGKTAAKTKTVTGTSLKVSKLKTGKVYQFRVRACKKVSGVKYCSAWSAWKKSKKVK